MAKKSGLIPTKPNAIKKIENDIAAFQFSVGEAGADLINLVQMEISKKGFLPAPNSVKNKGRKSQSYKVVPGANKQNVRGENTYHKSKILDRSRSLPEIFEELKFQKHRLGRTMYSAKNKGLDVKITRGSKKVTVLYKFLDKYAKIFGTFEGGFKTIDIKDINGKSKKQRVGQRKVVSNGFRRAVRRWKKLNTFRTEEALKMRSTARI
jgi:hypothetical protein